MRRNMVLFAVIAVVVTVGLMGCSGSGDGDGDGGGNGTPVDAALFGTWQPYEAAILGDPIGPREAFDWDDDVVKMTIQFIGDGTVTLRYYGHGGLVRTDTGTWTAEGGNATLNVDGEETNFEYSLDDRVMVISFTENAAQFRTRWVPVIDASGQAAELARTWEVTLVEVNGAVTPIPDFFDVPAGSTVVLGMADDGTLHFMVLHAEGDILEHMTGNWATQEELLVIQPPGSAMTLRGVWAAGNTSVTFLDEDGATAKLELNAWAPAGERDAALPGEWTAQSATVNGDAVDMATFFDWAQGTDRMILDLWTDGTAVVSELSAADEMLYGQLGTWNTDGGNLTLNLDEQMVMDYAIVGDTLTVNFTEDGDAIEITWVRAN